MSHQELGFKRRGSHRQLRARQWGELSFLIAKLARHPYTGAPAIMSEETFEAICIAVRTLRSSRASLRFVLSLGAAARGGYSSSGACTTAPRTARALAVRRPHARRRSLVVVREDGPATLVD